MRRKWKKKLGLLLLSSVIMLTAACANGSTGGNNPAPDNTNGSNTGAAKPLNIDFSLFSSENDNFSLLFQQWAKKVEEETEGRVTFTPYYSGALASLTDSLDTVKDGVVDAALLSAGVISGQIPSMGLLEPIGAFQSEEYFKNVYAEANPIIHKIFEDFGLHLFFWTPGNNITLSLNKDTVLKEPEQFKGLKLRTAGRWQSRQAELLGAVPVSLDPGDLYLGLQNKTVDGTFQIASLTRASKLEEVAPKMGALTASGSSIMYVIHPDVWNKISAEDQEVITRVSEEMALSSYKFLEEQDKKIVDSMIENGAEVTQLTGEEQAALLDKMLEVLPEAAENAGEEGKQIYEIMKKHQQ